MDKNTNHYISQALVITPGDKVLVALNDEPTQEEMLQMREGLLARFPDVEFTFISDVAMLAVKHA
jgi:hypothetical protein